MVDLWTGIRRLDEWLVRRRPSGVLAALPVIVVVVGLFLPGWSSEQPLPRHEVRDLAIAMSVGLLAGAAWQGLRPRDLADRLLMLALLALPTLAFSYAAPQRVHPGWGLVGYGWGLLAGLVLLERLRRVAYQRTTSTFPSSDPARHVAGR